MKNFISVLSVFLLWPSFSFANNAKFICHGQGPTHGYFEIYQFSDQGRLTRMLLTTHSGLVVDMNSMGPNNFPSTIGAQLYGIPRSRNRENLILTLISLPNHSRQFSASVSWAPFGNEELKLDCALN